MAPQRVVWTEGATITPLSHQLQPNLGQDNSVWQLITAEMNDNSKGIQNINNVRFFPTFSYQNNVRLVSTWVMERDQHKVFNGSGPPAQSLLQDPRGAIYHLFEIVVHGAGNIEHKGQSWRAVIGFILHIRPGNCKKPLLTDTERQHQPL